MKNYEISHIHPSGCMWINTSVRGIYPVLRVLVTYVI